MEHVCARCARLRLASGSSTTASALVGSVRAFSTSRISYDEDNRDSSSSFRISRTPLAGTSLNSALSRNAGQSPPRNLVIRRTGGRPAQDAGSRPDRPASEQSGARTSSDPLARAQAALRQRSNAGGSRVPPGRVLQRSGTARPGQEQPSVLPRRTTPPGQPRYGGSPSTRGGPQSRGGQQFQGGAQFRDQPQPGSTKPGHVDRRVRRLAQQTASRALEDEDPDAMHAQDFDTQVDNYIKTIVDPPVNPTEELPHTPGANMTDAELRKDWPPTPLSNAGLVESVQQRIEWLAKRLPHGYQTPNQLAMHYGKGYLTRFESAAERDEVVPIAKALAQKWADRDGEKPENAGKSVEPLNMDFNSLADRGSDRQGLTDTWVRGAYPAVTKQKMPFLDQIVRNLNNNPTVTSAKGEQFMQTVQSLLVSRSQAQQGGEQTQKTAQK